MAKKRKNQVRKHNNEESSDFMANLPESTQDTQWSASMDIEVSTSDSKNIINKDLQSDDDLSTEKKSTVENEGTAQPEHEHKAHQQNPLQEINEKPFEVLNEDEVMIEDHSVGSFLKQERLSLGIDLKNIVQSTKISLTNLEHLESDNLDALPDKAYVTGYVKSYSKLLSLNTQHALTLLDQTYQKLGKQPNPQEIVIPQAHNSQASTGSFPTKKIAFIILPLILLASIISMVFFNSSPSEDRVQKSLTKNDKPQKINNKITPQSLSAETPLQEEIIKIDTKALKEQEELPAKQALQKEKEPSLQAKEVKKGEEEKLVIKENSQKSKEQDNTANSEKKDEPKDKKYKFYQISSNLYQLDTQMDQRRTQELIPQRFRVAPIQGTQAVFITAIDGDSWITYKSDDEDTRKFVLKKGRSLLIRGKVTRVFLGNLGAVKIFLNNRPLNINSSSGVKSLVFPQEQAHNYVTPLFIYKDDGSVITSEQYLEENPQ